MEKLRVLLVDLPPVLRHILRELVGPQPDMAVVGEVRTLAGLPTAIESLRAEAVILTFSPQDDGRSVCAVRERYPALTILAIAPEADRAAVWLSTGGPRSVELSATGLLAALRQGA